MPNRWLEHLAQDTAYSFRQFRQNPGFVAAAILSLALGIGANTAIFQLLNAVRLRTLPVANPQELVEIRNPEGVSKSGAFTAWNPQLTNPQWDLLRQQQGPFAGLFAWSGTRFNVARGGEARNVEGLLVSGEFFRVLGVQPLLGRLIADTDDRRGCGPPAAVISYGFWQREYRGEASVLGATLTLQNQSAQIVGVTPPGFYGIEPGRSYDVAVPLCAETLLRGEDSRLEVRHAWWLTAMGRLKPGVTVEQATAYLNSVSPALYEATLPPRYQDEDRKSYLGLKLMASPAGGGISRLREQYEESLWLLLAIAGLVLLIACANLANLMLARASAREREIAIRMALGASRPRLLRQLLSESLMLAALGAAAGAWLAGSLSKALVAFVSTERTRWVLELPTDWRVLAFMAGLTALTCVLFGLAPALRATRGGPGEALKAGSRGLTAGRERFGLRRALVITQVSLSLVLVVGALLFGRSFQNLASQDAGVQQEGVLVTEVDFSTLNLPAARRLEFSADILARVRGIPGVAGAAQTYIVPLSGSGWNEWVWLEGQTQQNKTLVWLSRVSEGYFHTLEIPLLAGRDFDSRDTVTSVPVAIVNEAFVRRYQLGPSALGKRFRTEGNVGEAPVWHEIVGVVKDNKYRSLRADVDPTAFLPLLQDKEPQQAAELVIRSAQPLASVTAEVTRRMAELHPQIMLEFYVYKNMIRARLLQDRLMATLSSFFGGLAMVLAAVGLYGVIAYMVERRRNEIGIRMALGAQRGNVLALILREAGVLVAVGLAIGTLLSLAAGQAASSMLYGLQPYDAAMMAAAVTLLALIAFAASYVPARRAARVDPLVALRYE
jgi:predicted permease